MRKLIALVAVALVAAAIGLTVPAFAKTTNIGVTDNEFSKSSLTIKRLGKLHWAWNTSNDHNIVSTKRPDGAKKVRSGPVSTSGDYTYRFKKNGKYRIVCEAHPFDMVTKVTVKS